MATVGIIGAGYVGLPLAVAFAEEGCEVIAVDVDSRKVDAIARGDSYVEDVASEALGRLSGRIHATTRYARLAKANAVLSTGSGVSSFISASTRPTRSARSRERAAASS